MPARRPRFFAAELGAVRASLDGDHQFARRGARRSAHRRRSPSCFVPANCGIDRRCASSGPRRLAFLDRYHADAAFFGAGGFARGAGDRCGCRRRVGQAQDAGALGARLSARRSQQGRRNGSLPSSAPLDDLDVLVTGAPLDAGLDAALARAQCRRCMFAPDETVGAAA